MGVAAPASLCCGFGYEVRRRLRVYPCISTLGERGKLFRHVWVLEFAPIEAHGLLPLRKVRLHHEISVP